MPIDDTAQIDSVSQPALQFLRAVLVDKHDRPSLVADIACVIANDILERRLEPGGDINSVELARRFNTSRTPVREALMLLEREHLVTIPPRKRPRVAQMEMKEIREVYRARAAILEIIATDIARHSTEDQLAQLAEGLGKMQDSCLAQDHNRFLWANVEFHELSSEISGNGTAEQIMKSLMLRTLKLRRLSLSLPTRMQKSLEDHTRLLAAYTDRDVQLASALVRSIVMNALAALEEVGIQRA